MCLLIFAHHSDPRYPLVVAANRDEFHARPTAASDFWPEHPELLAGRDLEQGGTWMGITRGGRFAAITNYRDPSRTAPAPRSRGELPLGYLAGNDTPAEFLTNLQGYAEEYAGFNLLVGDRSSLWYLSNSSGTDPGNPRCLQPGTYGLSNAQLDTPWPKVVLGKNKLSTLLGSAPVTHASLATVVGDQQLADPETLRRQGMESSMEQILSAQFITTESYGTRSTTTLWTDREGAAFWRETSFDQQGEPRQVREETFRLD